MEIGAVTDYIDVAQLALYAFWIFFAALVYYLRQEDRREGYPLESDPGGVVASKFSLFFPIPRPKTFSLPDGSTVEAPNFERDTRQHKLEPVEPWPGAPGHPVGEPMKAGVGPGSYAERADIVEKTFEGKPKIVPLRADAEYAIAAADPDPKGMQVFGADRAPAGVVSDVWVDRSETLLRYLEVELATKPAKSGDDAKSAGGGTVLLPVTFADIDRAHGQVWVDAILASQFADVPKLKSPDTVTRLEEEKIVAYYGAGTLYAYPVRTESLL